MIYVTHIRTVPDGRAIGLARRLALLSWASDTRAWILETIRPEFGITARARGGTQGLHGLRRGDVRHLRRDVQQATSWRRLRLGFLILPPDLRERRLKVRRTTDLHPQDHRPVAWGINRRGATTIGI